MWSFGAVTSHEGVRFAVWAPPARQVELRLHDGAAAGAHPLAANPDGVFETWVRGAAPGDRYTYALDGSGPLPDPASRFQPDGVHGPSQIVDPESFEWHDRKWHARAARDLIVYELHVGTFSPEGTFAGLEQRLPYLRDLGITAIELMPVADFPGYRNWGYDGVALFAPSRAYGTPDDLRRVVDSAHRHGLSVILDVVYNHLGPEGAYVPRFNPLYFTGRHHTPWGDAINFDGPGSPLIRRFVVENAIHWVKEYHVDGLRLDATHALIDDSPKHILQQIAETVRATAGRPIVIHAEDHRNLAMLVEDPAAGGWGLDGVWADDFHHVVRTMVAGDTHGYYADFAGDTRELARVIESGWLYSGEHSAHMNQPRGTHPGRVLMHRFVVCLQNHDQVGNRAIGDRLHHTIPAETWRAVSVLLLTAPMTPLLFMGQEWAASTPFQYFTDLEPGLGRLVTDGRRREFADFPELAGAGSREGIPDPQSEATFLNSRLRWQEQSTGDHQRSLALYRALVALRLDHSALTGADTTEGSAAAPDDETIVVRRTDGRETFWIVARFKSAGRVDLDRAAGVIGTDIRGVTLELVLDTEHAEYADVPAPILVDGVDVHFQRPGAVILRQR
ncbi:MAG TPA: malto-oligosyltrehalose trehalohydrolase [Vicinamibacterales bacterium]|nr:malto-oligosyltrehalose trehalohydrolase [Vicinamibacterales bacterium]